MVIVHKANQTVDLRARRRPPKDVPLRGGDTEPTERSSRVNRHEDNQDRSSYHVIETAEERVSFCLAALMLCAVILLSLVGAVSALVGWLR